MSARMLSRRGGRRCGGAEGEIEREERSLSDGRGDGKKKSRSWGLRLLVLGKALGKSPDAVLQAGSARCLVEKL